SRRGADDGGRAAVEVEGGEALIGGEGDGCAAADVDSDIGRAGGGGGVDREVALGDVQRVVAAAAAAELDGLEVVVGDGGDGAAGSAADEAEAGGVGGDRVVAGGADDLERVDAGGAVDVEALVGEGVAVGEVKRDGVGAGATCDREGGRRAE